MKQLSEAFTGADFLIIALVCSAYDYLTLQWCLSVFTFLDSSVDLFILKTFSLSDFRCYKDHECSYMFVHAAMVGRVMLCGVGSMFGRLFTCPVVCE